MRLVWSALLCGTILAAAHIATRDLGRLLGQYSSSRAPIVRSYYHLTDQRPVLTFALPPGRSELKLRLHVVGIDSRAAAALLVSQRTLAGELLQTVSRLGFEPSSEPLIIASNGSANDASAGWGLVRLLTITMPEEGGLLEMRRAGESPEILVRLARRASLRRREDTSGQRFTRLAAVGALDELPPVVVLKHQRSATVRRSLGPEVHRDQHRQAYYLLTQSRDQAARARLANSTGGVVRLGIRLGLADGAAEGSARLNITLLSDKGVVRRSSEVVRAARDPRAVEALSWGTDAGKGLSLPSRWSAAVNRYIEYPAAATHIEAWTPEAASTPMLVSFATWGGPRSGAPTRQAAALATLPPWQTIAADNHDDLRQAGRQVWLTLEDVGGPAPASKTFHYVSLIPVKGKRSELLSPATGKATTTGKVRVRHQGERLCIADQGDGRGTLRVHVKLAHPERVGGRITAWAHDQVILTQELMATSVVVSNALAPAGCHMVRFAGVEPDDMLLVDAEIAPAARSFARTPVWSLRPSEPLRFPVRLSHPSRITVSLYSTTPTSGSIRAQIDGGRPTRRRGMSRHFTPPVVERDLWRRNQTELHLAHAPQISATAYQRMVVDLGDDLKPGTHSLTLELSSRSSIWVRASLRSRSLDDSSSPAKRPRGDGP